MRLCRIVAPIAASLAVFGCLLFAASASAASLPALVGSVSNSTSLSGTTAVAVAGHYAYTTAAYAGELTAVDISNPSDPVVAGHSPLAAGATCPSTACNALDGSDVTISGGYAFVTSTNANASTTSNDNNTGNSLTIFDIHTNPAVPSIVGTVRSTSELFGAYGIAVQGSDAFVAYQGVLAGGQPTTPDTSTGGFTVLDISNPTGPAIVANLDNGSLPGVWAGTNALDHADSVALSPNGQYAYVTASYPSGGGGSLTVIDISNPLAPSIVDKLSGPQFAAANDVRVQGNYAYVADQNDSPANQLTILSIANPANPTVVGTLSNPALNGAYRVAVRGSDAFVAGSSSDTISMVDVSNPAAPRVVATVASSAHLHRTLSVDFSVSGRYIVATSPYLSTESRPLYPPYPLTTGGPTINGTISVIDVDPSPPSVHVTRPANNAQYTPGQVVNASYSCTPGGLIPVTTCGGPVANGAPINTSTPGNYSFTVTGIDQDGQTASSTVRYTVGGPKISGLHQSARRWREHGPVHVNRRPPLGTKFSFTLTESAKVTLTFTQTVSGRKVGARCVALNRHNRHKRRCPRIITVGKFSVAGHQGRNVIPFAGRIHGRLLAPGTYTVALTASAQGVTSAKHTVSFTIVVS